MPPLELHFSVESVGRKLRPGRTVVRTAVAAAAYRSAALLVSERDGVTHDYRPRLQSVLESYVLAPDGADWVQDRAALWNAAEARETRRDAKTAREFVVGLHHEMSETERSEHVRRVARHLVDEFGVAVDVAIHKPDRDGDRRNVHVHYLFTTRTVDATGLGEKTRALDVPATSGPLILSLRRFIADDMNAVLKRSGSTGQVEHRSFVERGEALTPMQHLGPVMTGIERKAGKKERAKAYSTDGAIGIEDVPRTHSGRVEAAHVLPPAGVAGAGSTPATAVGRANAAIQKRNAPTVARRAATQSAVDEIAAELGEIRAAIADLEARKARAARLQKARGIHGIGQGGAMQRHPIVLPPSLARLVRAAPELTGRPVAVTVPPVAPVTTTPSAAPTNPSVTDDEISTRRRAAALKRSVAVVRAAWGLSPRTGDQHGIVLHWREARWPVDQQSADTRTRHLAHTMGLRDVTVSPSRGHHTASASLEMVGAYMESLPTASRKKFIIDLADAARNSAWAYLEEWRHEKFDGRRAQNPSVADQLLESSMAEKLGLPSRSLTEILGGDPAAPVTNPSPELAAGMAARAAVVRPILAASPPTPPATLSAPTHDQTHDQTASAPERLKGWAARVEITQQILAASPPTRPPEHDQVASAATPSTRPPEPPTPPMDTPKPDGRPERTRPIGGKRARAMLDNGTVVHVDSVGRVTMIARPETWNGTAPRGPGDTPGQHAMGRDSAGIGLNWTETRRDGWLVLWTTLDALAEAVGRLPIAEAVRWTARLARATVETVANGKQRDEQLQATRGGPEPARQPSAGPQAPSPAAAAAIRIAEENERRRRAATTAAGPASTIDEPIGADAANKLLNGAGLIYVDKAGDAELVMNVAGDPSGRRPAGEWNAWNAVEPFWIAYIMRQPHTLAGLTWNTLRLRAVDVAKIIGRRTRDGAMTLVDDLRRASDGGNAVKHRAETMAAETAEATRARDAARAEARAAEDARLNAIGEAAAAAARARRAAEAAAPGQPSKPKRRGRGRRPKGRGEEI